MDPRLWIPGSARLMLLKWTTMIAAFQFAVGFEAVRHDRDAWFDGLVDESMQDGLFSVGDVTRLAVNKRCVKLNKRLNSSALARHPLFERL